MNEACLELAPHVAALSLAALEPAEHARVSSHLEGCADCRAFAAEVERELAKTREPDSALAPGNAWERLEHRIGVERAQRAQQAGPALRVVLSCTFCHGSLEREAALFCASCLAPHHGDCFDGHGRCAAPGCSEVRAVAPRERVAAPAPAPKRSRRAPLVLALLLGAGSAVAALVPLARRAPEVSLADALGEPDRAPPPYPWGAGNGSAARTLRSHKVTFNFGGTPLSEFVSFLHDITGLEYVIDPSIDAEAVKVNLRLKDAILWNALWVMVDQLGLTLSLDGNAVRIVPGASTAKQPLADLDLDALAERQRGDRELRTWLESQPLTCKFDETPFGEAVEFLRDVTGVNYVITTGAQDLIDNEEMKVTHHKQDGSVAAFLDVLVAGRGLAWETRNGLVVIRNDGSAPPPSELASRRVTLSLRGVTIPELVARLTEQGIETATPESTWVSSGTVSIICHDEPVDSFVATLTSWTPLRAYRIGKPEVPREILLLDGVAASARQALAAESPPGYAGVASELADLKRRLRRELPERANARAAGERTPPEALAEAERAVDLDVTQILSLARRCRRYARADSRRAEVERARAEAGEAIEKAKQRLHDELLSHEKESSAASNAVVATEYTLSHLQGERTSQARFPHADMTAIDRSVAAAEENLAKARSNQTQVVRDHANREIRLKNEISNKERRQGELTRELGVVDRDLDVAHRLERGARLAEAEGR